jgi:hypothetical protein
MKSTFRAGKTLYQDLGILINEDAHKVSLLRQLPVRKIRVLTVKKGPLFGVFHIGKRGSILSCKGVHIPVIGDFAGFFQHTHILGILQKFGGEYELVEPLIFTEYDLPVIALPFLIALVHVQDIIADLHHTVHIMRVYHGGHIKLFGNFLYQPVNYQGGLGIEAGVGFVAKKIFGI